MCASVPSSTEEWCIRMPKVLRKTRTVKYYGGQNGRDFRRWFVDKHCAFLYKPLVITQEDQPREETREIGFGYEIEWGTHQEAASHTSKQYAAGSVMDTSITIDY